MRRDKRSKYLLLLILLLGISVGYALLSTTLKINGSATITKNNWSVYWANPVVTDGSVTTTAPTLSAEANQTLNTIATWTTTLNLPGDFYEFTIDAVNNGSIDAMITDIENTVTPTLPSYIKYTVTYADGKPILENHLLSKKTGNTATIQKYKVRVEFLNTITPEQMNAVPEGGLTYTFTYEITYTQANGNAVVKPGPLQDDSWATIVANVKNDPSSYSVGETKTIEMDLDGDNTNETYTLRVANNTTPAECSTEGFSETACGFVLEFQDVIAKHRMNAHDSGDPSTYQNGNGNKGGWEYSDMRAYLNSSTYAYENVDYSTTGIYSKLPSDLKDNIISTKVVFGLGFNNSNTSSTNDKLYILTTKEIYGANTNNGETDGPTSRQLDYYREQGVSFDDYRKTTKTYQNAPSYYWTRSTIPSPMHYMAVNELGGWPAENADSQHGVSPAFRIG